MMFLLIARSAFLAIPFYFLWNYFAPIYGTNLPALYQHFPFWHVVGIFALWGVVKAALWAGHARWHFRRGYHGHYGDGHRCAHHGGGLGHHRGYYAAEYSGAKFKAW